MPYRPSPGDIPMSLTLTADSIYCLPYFGSASPVRRPSPAVVRPKFHETVLVPSSSQIAENSRRHNFFLEVVDLLQAENVRINSSFAITIRWAITALAKAGLEPRSEAHILHNGSICFDWMDDPQNQLSVAIQRGNSIAYAAYFSGEKIHGVCPLTTFALSRPFDEVVKKWQRRDAAGFKSSKQAPN